MSAFCLVGFLHCEKNFLATAIRQIRDIKGQIGREEVKFSLFADAMTLHIEKLKGSTKKLLELMNEFRCRIQNYIHKSVVFLYTNNELLQIEIKKTILFSVK